MPCSSGDLSRELLPNAAITQLSIPDFSVINSLIADAINLLSQPIPSPPTHQIPFFIPVPGTHLKHKRNVRTRQQYKKRRMLRLTVSSQEVDQSDVKEVEHHTVEREDSKHVFLLRSQRDWSTCCWHAAAAAIQSEVLMDGMIMIERWTNGMRRLGVG